MSKKTTIFISIVGVALFVAAISAVSYAYYTSNIETSGEATTTTTAAKISADFNGGSALTVTNLIPGDTFTKTFSLTNTGTETIYYRISMKNVENDFTRQQDITYILTENGNPLKKAENGDPIKQQFLSAAGPLSDKLSIDEGETKTYSLTITYENEENIDQKDDMLKTISGDIYIEAY